MKERDGGEDSEFWTWKLKFHANFFCCRVFPLVSFWNSKRLLVCLRLDDLDVCLNLLLLWRAICVQIALWRGLTGGAKPMRRNHVYYTVQHFPMCFHWLCPVHLHPTNHDIWDCFCHRRETAKKTPLLWKVIQVQINFQEAIDRWREGDFCWTFTNHMHCTQLRGGHISRLAVHQSQHIGQFLAWAQSRHCDCSM